MTPAEQAFFAVLEPIVRSSCMVSSKVRLADLFDVRQERDNFVNEHVAATPGCHHSMHLRPRSGQERIVHCHHEPFFAW